MTNSFSFKKNYFEELYWAQQQIVIGIDEVGRGCLAGPLVTAAVALTPGKLNRLLKDSKIMTVEEREKAYAWLCKHARMAIGIVDHATIDNLNIYQATLKAMKKAVLHLLATETRQCGAILIDAMPLSLTNSAYCHLPIHHFPFGERKSSSIAAASIVAKVTRDRLMTLYSSSFPHYGLANHKGYATKYHQQMLSQHGHSLIHRMSFVVDGLPVAGITHEAPKIDYEYQQTLC